MLTHQTNCTADETLQYTKLPEIILGGQKPLSLMENVKSQ